MIGSLIDAISRGNSMGGTTRVLNPLQFVPLYKGAEEISTGVETWLRLLWGESLKNITSSDWLEQKGDHLLWEPPLSLAETEL